VTARSGASRAVRGRAPAESSRPRAIENVAFDGRAAGSRDRTLSRFARDSAAADSLHRKARMSCFVPPSDRQIKRVAGDRRVGVALRRCPLNLSALSRNDPDCRSSPDPAATDEARRRRGEDVGAHQVIGLPAGRAKNSTLVPIMSENASLRAPPRSREEARRKRRHPVRQLVTDDVQRAGRSSSRRPASSQPEKTQLRAGLRRNTIIPLPSLAATPAVEGIHVEQTSVPASAVKTSCSRTVCVSPTCARSGCRDRAGRIS